MSTPELTLSGSPRERGRAHGEAFRDLIDETIERWLDAIAQRINPHEFVAMVNRAGFRASAEVYAPDLLDEVHGIAEGSDQTSETMFAWQLIDECWWYLDELTEALEPHESCSALAVNADGRGLVAQTQDLYRHFDGSQVMLRYLEDDGLEILAPSAAGLLAYNGVNSAGLGVCITTLSELAHQTGGVSSGFVVPSLLRCRSVDEGLAWLSRTPIASGNSFSLGMRDRSLVVEASATSIEVVDDGDRALHTNHALSQSAAWEYVRFANSVERLEQLESSVRPNSTLDEIAEMYSSGPVCQSRSSDSPFVTVGTMIFELDDEQTCHFAAGPLDSSELRRYTMSDRDE